MISNRALWERLADFAFDAPDAAFPFTKRLARDNRWTDKFAARVVEEYKRFAYLAMVAGREVTPSDEVDQAWHLHLTYTRHYWGPFVEALGAPLHHGPTAGGAVERTRYEDNYAATLEAYETEFGVKPPSDIWPPSARRFAVAPFMQRLDTSEYYLAPKSLTRRLAAGAAALTAGGAVVAAQAASGESVQSLLDKLLDKPAAMVIAGTLIVIVIAALVYGGSAKRKGRESSADAAGVGVVGGSGKGSGAGKGDGGCGGDSGGSGCGGGGGCGGCGG